MRKEDLGNRKVCIVLLSLMEHFRVCLGLCGILQHAFFFGIWEHGLFDG